MIVRRCLIIAMFAASWAGCALAADTIDVPTATSGVERVKVGKVDAYRHVLSDFDAALSATPDDPAPAIEKCRFIAEFVDNEDVWIERASADLETCTQHLDARWPKEPGVRLFGLDQLWGEDAIAMGEGWLDESKNWPPAARRHLLSKLSESYDSDDSSGRGGDYAVQATRMGEPSQVAAAVERLIATGHATEAQTLLRAAPPAVLSWRASKRVMAALTLPDRGAALAELHRYDRSDVEVDALAAAKAYLRAGDSSAARKRLQAAPGKSAALQETRFEVALATSDMTTAVDLVDLSGGKDFAIAIQRFAVVAGQAPAMLFSGKMVVVGLFLLMMLGLMALAPGLVLVPIHYRGLFRRTRGKPATPLFETIGLRHAWIGGAIAICLPLLVAVVIAPTSVATVLDGKILPAQSELLRLALWGAVLGLLLILPLLRRLGVRRILGDRHAWKSWWRVLVSWAILIVVGFVIARINSHSVDTSTLQTKAIESLVEGGRQQYGTGLTLLLIAVVVPIYEELVFRGLLLGGMSAHIGFGWANIFQAVMFALMHGDTPRFAYYLALGLLAGWLVKKSNSLGPSIALHGANNALATLVRIAAAAT